VRCIRRVHVFACRPDRTGSLASADRPVLPTGRSRCNSLTRLIKSTPNPLFGSVHRFVGSHPAGNVPPSSARARAPGPTLRHSACVAHQRRCESRRQRWHPSGIQHGCQPLGRLREARAPARELHHKVVRVGLLRRRNDLSQTQPSVCAGGSGSQLAKWQGSQVSGAQRRPHPPASAP
jgi:hypothetical protein